MTARGVWWRTVLVLAAGLACSSGDGANGGAAGAPGGGGTPGGGGAGAFAGGPGCDVAPDAGSIMGTCSSVTGNAAQCAESVLDLSHACAGSAVWTAGGSCPYGALYCCTSATGAAITCFYGEWSDWGGSEAAARTACADAHGSWCPR